MQMAISGIDTRRFDIWRYQALYGESEIPEEYLISDCRDAFTPLVQRDDHLWIKHEDRHPLGSHKGRSLAYQLSALSAAGKKKFVISSSGNAAIAFLSLTPSAESIALVPPGTDPAKLVYLQGMATVGHCAISPIAIKLAQLLVKKKGFIDLRPSQSREAMIGLQSLGFELYEQVSDLSQEFAIVAVTTSGGNVLGMYQAFMTLKKLGMIQSLPRMYPVLLTNYQGGYLSPERQKSLDEMVVTTGGRILRSDPVRDGNEQTSFEGNTAHHMYQQCQKELGKTILLFTGRIWPSSTQKTTLPTYSSLVDLTENFNI